MSVPDDFENSDAILGFPEGQSSRKEQEEADYQMALRLSQVEDENEEEVKIVHESRSKIEFGYDFGEDDSVWGSGKKPPAAEESLNPICDSSDEERLAANLDKPPKNKPIKDFNHESSSSTTIDVSGIFDRKKERKPAARNKFISTSFSVNERQIKCCQFPKKCEKNFKINQTNFVLQE